MFALDKSLIPYALAAAAAMLLMYFFPWVEFVQGEQGVKPYVLTAYGYFNQAGIRLVDVEPMLPGKVFVGLSAAFFAVSTFVRLGPSKRRAFVMGAIMISLLLLASSFITSNSFQAYSSKQDTYFVLYKWPLLMPLLALVAGFFSLRIIEKA